MQNKRAKKLESKPVLPALELRQTPSFPRSTSVSASSDGFLGFTRGQWVGMIVGAGGSAAGSALVNYLSSSPLILYFCVPVLLAWLGWQLHRRKSRLKWVAAICGVLIFYGTHKYVSHVLAQAKNPKANGSSETVVSNAPVGPTLQEEIAFYSRTAHARQWTPPTLPKNYPDIGGKKLVHIIFGSMRVSWEIGSYEQETAPDSVHPVTFPGSQPILAYIKDDRVFVSAQTPFGDREGAKTVTLNNEWPSKLPDGWDRNFNESSFEIVNGRRTPVFQLRYRAANVIEIYGVFVASNGAITIAFPNGTDAVPPGREIPEISKQRAWFQYPSKDHLGELAK